MVRVPPEEAAGSTALADSQGQTSVDRWPLSTLHEKLLFFADGLLTFGVCGSVWSTDGPGVDRMLFVRLLATLIGGGELIDSQGQTLSSAGRIGVESLVLLDLMKVFVGKRIERKTGGKQRI